MLSKTKPSASHLMKITLNKETNHRKEKCCLFSTSLLPYYYINAIYTVMMCKNGSVQFLEAAHNYCVGSDQA